MALAGQGAEGVVWRPRRARVVESRGGWLQISWSLKATDILILESKGIAAAAGTEPGTEVTGWVEAREPEVSTYSLLGRDLVTWTEWLGRLFLALIKMVVVPLVFCSLVVGVASLGDFRRLGRLGGRTLGLFMTTTVFALTIGVGLANLISPGSLMSEEDRSRLLASYEGAASNTVSSAAEAPSFTDQIVGIVPANPFEALAEGQMLQIIFFGREHCPARGHDLSACPICSWAATKKRIREESD